MVVGVLSVQGDVSEHIDSVKNAMRVMKIDDKVVEISSKKDLEKNRFDAIILPGGESTTIARILKDDGIYMQLKELHTSGTGFFGTCAGAIILSTKIEDSDLKPLDIIDITVRRNSYGRQKDSFEVDLEVTEFKDQIHSVFIRAPIITHVGENVKVLAVYNNLPVLVSSNRDMVATFHPELTADYRIHQLFLSRIYSQKKIKGGRVNHLNNISTLYFNI